jgi:hypothetical protein
MRLAAMALAVVALPALANARPITAGLSVGRIQSKADANSDASATVGLFGRLTLSPRVSTQLELQRIQTDDTSVDIRTATGLLVVDLGADKHLVPLLMVGGGFDSASYSYGSSTDGHHLEGGFGLEYRSDGGFVIGADVRMGGRSIDSDSRAIPLTDVAYYAPSTLHDGEYRSARLTVGVRF